MPAMVMKVNAKTKRALKGLVTRKINEAKEKGLGYVKRGYDENRVKKVKGGYEIEIEVHSL